jgi:hypothetical protein
MSDKPKESRIILRNYCESDDTLITISINPESTLTELCMAFTQFARASGYCFDGNIEVVEEEVQS